MSALSFAATQSIARSIWKGSAMKYAVMVCVGVIALVLIIAGVVYFASPEPKPVPKVKPKPKIDRSEIDALERKISSLISELTELKKEYSIRKYNWSKCHNIDDYIDYVLSEDKGMIGARLISIDDSARKMHDLIYKSVNEKYRLESVERLLGYRRRRYKKISSGDLEISKPSYQYYYYRPSSSSSKYRSSNLLYSKRHSSSGSATKLIGKLSRCHDAIEKAKEKRKKILEKLNAQRKECRKLIVEYRKAIKKYGIQLIKQLKELRKEKRFLEKKIRDKERGND